MLEKSASNVDDDNNNNNKKNIDFKITYSSINNYYQFVFYFVQNTMEKTQEANDEQAEYSKDSRILQLGC